MFSPLPYTTMDDEGLPLSSPLPLSQPAVQAPHDNPDAAPSSESTGGDVRTPASDRGPLGGVALRVLPVLPPLRWGEWPGSGRTVASEVAGVAWASKGPRPPQKKAEQALMRLYNEAYLQGMGRPQEFGV